MRVLAPLAAMLLCVQPAFSAPPTRLRTELERVQKDNIHLYRIIQTLVVMDAATYCSPRDKEIQRLNGEIELALVKHGFGAQLLEKAKVLRQASDYGKSLVDYVKIDLGGCPNALGLQKSTHATLVSNPTDTATADPDLKKLITNEPGYVVNFLLAVHRCLVQVGHQAADESSEEVTKTLNDWGLTPTQIANLIDRDRMEKIIQEVGGCSEMYKRALKRINN